MKFKVRCRQFECREDIHFKTQPGLLGLRLGIEPAPLWISRPTLYLQKTLLADLALYIFTTLEFTTPYFKFHLLTTSVNAKC